MHSRQPPGTPSSDCLTWPDPGTGTGTDTDTETTTILREQGHLPGARWCPSPNYGARPEPAEISLLVIHNISLPPGQFGGGYIEAFFQNRLDHRMHPYFATIEGIQVSAHALIERTGDLVQFVDLRQRAWHAGRSSFCGREECNDYSIGIELEGTDDQPYTEAQYHTLARVAADIMAAWPDITPDRIVGHSDIAPGRKTDPGPAFDWAEFRRRLLAPADRPVAS